MNSGGTSSDGGSGSERFHFDGIVVDAVAHTLSKDGQRLQVEPKAFAVLLILLRHAGELVNRDDLLDAVWGHRHVTPGVLTRVIAQLRHVLDDDAHEPRYIETMHALGYCFVGILELDPEHASAPVAPSAVASPSTEPGAGADDGALDSPLEALGSGAAQQVQAAPEPRLAIPRQVASGPSRASRLWLAAVAVLLVAALAVAWLDRSFAPQRPADASVAVLPFVNLSSARDDSYFAEGLAVEMHDALAGVRGLKVAAQPVGSVAVAGSDIKQLGRLLGVATVLQASVRRDGQRVRVNARLSDTRTGFTLWSRTYDRETSDVFALQSEIANQVVQSLLGVLPAEQPRLVSRLEPTRDVAAYDAYLKGLQQLQGGGGAEQLDRAIGFFGQALAADVGFARAQAGICRAEIRRFEQARDSAAFARAQIACDRAARMDPGLREVSLARGEMHRTRGETEQALEQYSKALDDLALRPAAYIGLAKAHSALGDHRLALEYFQRALALRPGDGAIHRALGYHYFLSGDLPSAIASYRAAATLQPDDAAPWNSLGGLYLAQGDVTRASDAFNRSLAIKPSYSALSNLGTLKYGQGAYAEAAVLYRRAAELDPDDYRVWGNIGDALSAVPATAAQAREAYLRAANMVQQYSEIKTDDAQALGLLAWYRANLGQAASAREALTRAEALSSERGEVALLGAQIFALLGDLDAARDRLALARQHDIPMQRIQASPLLRRLQGGDADVPNAPDGA
ncbi:MAG TPA: tetratricopeptide repeat protein [Lysobacter sp.]|nr:tetratricopeptide repeat protein [Lysobacter sp.]